MKTFTTFILSLTTLLALLLAGCDGNFIIQQDTPPSLNSQTGALDEGAVTSDSTAHNRYIVQFKQQPDGLASSQAAQQAVQQTNSVLSEVEVSRDSLIHQYKIASFGFAGRFSPEQAEKLRAHPLVEHVVKDIYYKAIEAGRPRPTLMTGGNQTIPWGISRVNGPFDGTGTTAWVLDTGVDLDHPDLNVDLGQSVSFVSSEPSADDQNGHGTHVSGTLAAKHNHIDVVGVAAGASVVAVKVIDSGGGGYVSDVKAGVEYAAANFNPGDVANMSLGYPESCPSGQCDITLSSMESSIINAADAGLKFVIAAGNFKQDATGYSPARVQHPNVWTISAFKQGDVFANDFDCTFLGSNFGNPPIEYSMPGNNIFSLGGTRCGTSMAAPHLAGLLLAVPQDIDTDGVVSNDPDFDPDLIAVGPPSATLPPPPPQLNVSIPLPYALDSGEQGTWMADVQDGAPPYSYQWSYREPGSLVWQTGGTNQTFSHTFYVSGSSSENAYLKVVVTSSAQQAEDEKAIIISPDDCPPGHICS